MKQETKSKLSSLLFAPLTIVFLVFTFGLVLMSIFETLNFDLTAGGVLASQAPLLISGLIFFNVGYNNLREVFESKLSIKVILAGFVIAFVSILINIILSSYLSTLLPVEESASATEMITSNNSLFIKIVIPVIIAPVVEEFTFRAGLRSYLEKAGWGTKGYIVISSILFGLLHWAPGQYINIAMTGVLGLIWSIIYIKTNNIYIPIVSHSFYNLIVVMIATYS